METEKNYSENYSESEKELRRLMESDPRAAQILVDMKNGTDPLISLIRIYGDELRGMLDTPELQESILEANGEYRNRCDEHRRLAEQYEANMSRTLEGLEKFREERGLAEEEIDAIGETLVQIARETVNGDITPGTLALIAGALTRDRDIAAAREQGVTEGRNAKIKETMRHRNSGDGIAPLGGRNTSSHPSRDPNLFDLAGIAI